MRSFKPAQNPQILGLQALAWLAADQNALEMFLKASGVEPGALRAAADRPETAAAVLDFLLANEALLVAFCKSEAIAPEAVHLARHWLEV